MFDELMRKPFKKLINNNLNSHQSLITSSKWKYSSHHPLIKNQGLKV